MIEVSQKNLFDIPHLEEGMSIPFGTSRKAP
jgi:hypothetical protein